VTDLGVLPPPGEGKSITVDGGETTPVTNGSLATGINKLGQVIGVSDGKGFVWMELGGMQEVKTPGSPGCHPTGINDLGEVVGWKVNPGQPSHSGGSAFSWTAGSVGKQLFPGNNKALGVNAFGQVAGEYLSKSTGHWQSFLLTEGTETVDLGTLGGNGSEALAINDAAEVTGSSQTANGDWHAFRWNAQQGMQDLGTLGGTKSYARGINVSGQIVGESELAGDKQEHAFLWTADKGMQDLGAVKGGNSRADGVNASGQVVGYFAFGENHYACRWTPGGGLQGLNKLVDVPGWQLEEATAINDAGQIVGRGINPAGEPRAFLLTPVTAAAKAW
jgi:probable HAF family extracellular repeat protein